jgi:hypothetical protein
MICHAAGALVDAERAFTRSLELGTTRVVTTAMFSLVLLDQGRGEDALASAQSEPDEFWRKWAKAIIFDRLGRKTDADAALADLISMSGVGDAYQVAEVLAARGDLDDAFDWLDRAVAIHDPGVTHIKASPCLRSLYGDPRWNNVLKKIGFEV